MSLIRVKICGLTRLQDVTSAVHAGADALGFVFVPASKRNIDIQLGSELLCSVPAFVSRVGLFLNQEAEFVRQVLDNLPLSLLQFHGDEDPGYCSQFRRPYIKAINPESGHGLDWASRAYPDAAGLLLDSHAHGALGGTGMTLDWDSVAADIKACSLPVILAGGLLPDNVARAVKATQPWAVDVSSGVEVSPGIKDHSAIERFIEEAKRGQ